MSRWLPGEHRAASCTGKIRYETGADAGKAKQRMRKHKRSASVNRSEVDVYRCQYCGCWHLGRPTVWKAKRKGDPPKLNPRDFAIRR